MKTNLVSNNSKRTYLIALVIATLVASMLPFTGFAASSKITSQSGFGLSTIQKIENTDANTAIELESRALHTNKMTLAAINTGNQNISITTKPDGLAFEGLIDEVAPTEIAPAIVAPTVVAPAVITPAVVASVEVASAVIVAPAASEITAESVPAPTVSGLTAFAAKVTNGNSDQITGLYSENIFALSVIQQSGDASYVSPVGNTITQFSMASGLGFLAHNYLAGSLFFSLSGGALVVVVYGDGHTQSYRVSQIRKFQALSPESPYSDFVDLASGNTLSAPDLFYATYGVGGQLVLQTCISANGNSSWGRLFVIATPSG